MRERGQRTTPQLAGSLLLAHPMLRDPNFRKSVIFVATHDAEGALGFVLNRPTEKTLSEYLPDNDELTELADVPVFVGGPVASNQLVVAVFQSGETGIKFTHNISAAQLGEFLGDPDIQIRAFVGYSGWSGGQLETELKQDSWIVHPPTAAILDPARCSAFWYDTVAAISPIHRLMADAPDDPSVN